MSVQLTDVNAGDGGFCIIKGSHKSNFAVPKEVVNCQTATEHVYVQPPALPPSLPAHTSLGCKSGPATGELGSGRLVPHPRHVLLKLYLNFYNYCFFH